MTSSYSYNLSNSIDNIFNTIQQQIVPTQTTAELILTNIGTGNVQYCDLLNRQSTGDVFDYVFHNDNDWKKCCDTITLPSYPKTNVFIDKTNHSINIEAAVIGFTKDDVTLEVEGNILTIIATKKSDKEDDNKKYLKQDLAQRSFTVRYELSKRMDLDNIKVKIADGLLKIHIPMKDEEIPKKKTLTIE